MSDAISQTLDRELGLDRPVLDEPIPNTANQAKKLFPALNNIELIQKQKEAKALENSIKQSTESLDSLKSEIADKVNFLSEIAIPNSVTEFIASLFGNNKPVIENENVVELLALDEKEKELENKRTEISKSNIESAADIYTYPLTPIQPEEWENQVQEQTIKKPEVPDLPLNF